MTQWWLAGILFFLGAAGPATAQVSVSIGVPSIDIGIHLPALPALTLVPGSPVYYAPSVDGNFFFYDGMYWVYQSDNWYSSSWYSGPWALVDPEIVPPFILQVPVRYYRRPPAYFHGWAASAPPRWAEHWGPAWAEKHRGWDQGDREARSATIQGAGVERVILRGIREIRDGKIAALRCCLPERSDAQTARFLEWEEVHAPLDGGIAPPLVTLC